MCTVVILRRPDHDWPLILAANRDEMADRPWRGPGRHWPDRGNVVAGIDELAGGTWLGVNDEGVAAGLLNRHESLGPDPRLRSRGELVLEALDHFDAVEAAEALGHLDGRSWRSFNMVIADNRDAYWVRSLGAAADGKIEIHKLPEGISMITSGDLNEHAAPRIRRNLARFTAAPPPDPENGDWFAWQTLLGDRGNHAGWTPEEAMNVVTDRGFGTLSSSLIALPSMNRENRKPVWLFTNGRPDEASWDSVTI
jgi:uncharacterized protein with NRDE domain